MDVGGKNEKKNENLFEFFFKVRKKTFKILGAKIAGKTYTSILVLLLRSEEDLVFLVMPYTECTLYMTCRSHSRLREYAYLKFRS